jgi:hypothetical protein
MQQIVSSTLVTCSGRSRETNHDNKSAGPDRLLFLSGCSTAIRGTVQLVDARQQPITNDKPEGRGGQHDQHPGRGRAGVASAPVNEKGEFESPKDALTKGVYKVEVSRIGYETQTETVEVGSFFGKTIQFKLPKIQETRRKSIKGSATDEDKIINPGEVNIQPPAM